MVHQPALTITTAPTADAPITTTGGNSEPLDLFAASFCSCGVISVFVLPLPVGLLVTGTSELVFSGDSTALEEASEKIDAYFVVLLLPAGVPLLGLLELFGAGLLPGLLGVTGSVP